MVENKIKEFRKKMKLTQGELAKAIGCTERAIGYYENHERKVPLEIAIKLSKYFKKDIEEIFY